MKELKNLKDTIEEYRHLKRDFEDVQTLIQMGYEESDPTLIPEIEEALNVFIKDLEELKLRTLLSGEYDKYNAIITLHAGAGGTESCDWASMLCRMYQRWADKKGFTTEMIDFLEGEEAGLKSVTLQISGENAYGYLKSERGVHRLVRISPFNAAKIKT
jgi:peptide chain release factor 2